MKIKFTIFNKKISKIKYLTVFSFMLLSITVFGQLPMIRTTFNGTFNPIYSGTSVGSGSVSTATGDDATQDNLPIGFSFNYLGTTYTTVGVSTNGWASFVGTLGGSVQNGNTNLFSTIGPNLSVGPWWDDLASDSIIYKTTGTPGSQIFTIQWNAKSYYTGSTQLIKFQLHLFEGTNVMEFHYGSVTLGTNSTSESASIGIEGATGGNGNWLDAVTGSAFVGHAFMNSTTKWPTKYYRFTPGTPTVMTGGTYNVGAGQTYPTIDEAIADMNHRGISGAVTFALTQAMYDVTPANGDNILPIFVGPVAGSSSTNSITIQPASGTSTIAYEGAVNGNAANGISTGAFGNTNEPIIGLVGCNNVTIRNLYLTTAPTLTAASTGTVVDRGIALINQSAALGTSSCSIKNVTVALSRGNTSSIAFETRVPTTPTVSLGANSNNTFMDVIVSNVYNGILFSGNATFPDLNNMLTTSSPTLYNTIGSSTPNDIGNGTATSYGVQALNQSSVTINNNVIQNITVNGTVVSDGIFLNAVQGLNRVYNNKIMNIRNNSTTATSGISGIRANIATTGTHEIRVYNNFVSALTSSYTGAASATRQLRGIYVQSAGGGVTTSTINVDFNNVSIDGTTSPNISSSCFEIGTTSGPVINSRNNVFANYTGTQTAPAKHLTRFSTSATLIGNTGSISNYNDLYVANTTQGFVGTGNTTDYATLANWQAAMVGQDVNSQSCSPGYVNNNTDLHVTSLCLDGTGNSTGISWVTTDIDNLVRNPTPDIGADEFSVCSSVSGGTVAPGSSTICSNQNISLNATGATVGGGISYVWQVSSSSTGPFTDVSVGTGSNTTSYNTGTLSAGTYFFRMQTTCSSSSLTASSNTVSLLVNPSPVVSSSTVAPLCVGQDIVFTSTTSIGTNFAWFGPLSYTSSALSPTITNVTTGASGNYTLLVSTSNCTSTPVVVSVTVSPAVMSIAASPVIVCGSGSTTLTATGNYTAITWNTGATTNSIVVSPTVTTTYSATGSGTVVSSCYFAPTITVSVQNPTITGIGSTVCSPTAVGTLTANAFAPVNWYATSTSTAVLGTGSTFTASAASTTTFYAEAASSVNLGFVGLTNTVSGGGQQTSTAYNIFDVFTPIVINSVEVYPGAVGNVVVDLLDNTGTLITSTTVAVSSTAGPITIPINFSVSPGNGYRLAQGAGSVSMFRNTSGVVFPYSISSVLSMTNSSAGTSFYYFFYNWSVKGVGCTSPKIPVVLTVDQPTVVLTASQPSVCLGSTVNIGASGATTYSWSNSATTTSITVSPTTTTTYSVIGTNTTGCTGTSSISITSVVLPTISISGSSVACSGATVNLTANGASTYTWNTSANTASIAVSPSVNTTYTASGTSTLGCVGSNTFLVNASANPTVTIAGSNSICIGSSINLTASGASSYNWNTGATTSSIAASPTITTTYTVVGANGSCTTSATKSVTVNALPTVSVAASSYTACTNGSNIGLTGTPTGGTFGGTNVSGTVFTPGATAGTFIPTYAYTNTVTGCSNTASTSIVVSVCTGINSKTANTTSILVHPNPNSGIFTIEFVNGLEKTIQVTDLTGRIVLENTTSEDVFNVNINTLANGVYYVKVISNNTAEVLKVVKQ
ncbi:MAG: T9SS type A sorting domain-containing protein [Bacteroidota bacterium]|nr:T9SS type A sorting domain-containing protein [Bacteroidota bacterium]